MIRVMAAIAAFIAAQTVMSASAQGGPALFPSGGSENTVFPIVERPEGGWPDVEWEDPANFCAPGAIATLRVSQIIGSREVYDEARAEHLAWYRDFGFTENDIVELPIMLPNPDTGVWAGASELSLSLHVNPPPRGSAVAIREEDEDAAAQWDAYVDKYRQSSKIIEEAMVCVQADRQFR